jgi:hypothetical protein
MADLAVISRRKLIEIAVLSSATLMFSSSPALADLNSNSACPHGGQPCTHCTSMRLRRALTGPAPRGVGPRLVNPWINPKDMI